MAVEIKNRFTGKVMLSIDVPNLLGADLLGANLRDADMQDANLRDANLRSANLRSANLLGANLLGADMRDADMRRANLLGADIAYCIGDGTIIRTMQTPKYQVVVCDDWLQIGCKGYRLHEWESFDDDEIRAMDDGALEWWNANKALVFAFVDADGMGE